MRGGCVMRGVGSARGFSGHGGATHGTAVPSVLQADSRPGPVLRPPQATFPRPAGPVFDTAHDAASRPLRAGPAWCHEARDQGLRNTGSVGWKPGSWKPGSWKPGSWKPGSWKPGSWRPVREGRAVGGRWPWRWPWLPWWLACRSRRTDGVGTPSRRPSLAGVAPHGRHYFGPGRLAVWAGSIWPPGCRFGQGGHSRPVRGCGRSRAGEGVRRPCWRRSIPRRATGLRATAAPTWRLPPGMPCGPRRRGAWRSRGPWWTGRC